MSRPAAADKVTVKVVLAALSSLVVILIDASGINNSGVASSSVIVRVAVASEMVAVLLTPDKVRVTVSLASSKASARTATLKVLVV